MSMSGQPCLVYGVRLTGRILVSLGLFSFEKEKSWICLRESKENFARNKISICLSGREI